MHIRRVLDEYELPDGRKEVTYLLSGPVTNEVIERLSSDEPVLTGYQYLSPAYSLSKPDGTVISITLKSPVIKITCNQGIQIYSTEYLDALLSTINDSLTIRKMFVPVKFKLLNLLLSIKIKKPDDEQEKIKGELIIE